MSQEVIDLMNENARLKDQLEKATNREWVREAIRKAFFDRGLTIAHELATGVAVSLISSLSEKIHGASHG